MNILLLSEEDESIKEGSASSSSLIMQQHNLNMLSNCSDIDQIVNMQQDVHQELCTMCGDVGFAQYLFKCLTCSHRYQHIYCSKFYPHKMEAAICNWCLPMELEIKAEIDDMTNNYDNNLSNFNNSDQIITENQPIQPIKKHCKAFEYLLQIAELDDPNHPFNDCSCPNEDNAPKINDLGHHQIFEFCNFYEVGLDHPRKKLLDQHMVPAHLLQQERIISGCGNGRDRSIYMMKRGNKDSVRGPGAGVSSKRLRHNVHSQLEADVSHNQNQNRQIIRQMFNDQSLAPDHEPALHGILQSHSMTGYRDDDPERKLNTSLGAAAARRAPRQRQLQQVAGDDQMKVLPDHQRILNLQAANIGFTDEGQVAKSCGVLLRAVDNMGAANRLIRHRQSQLQVAGDDHDDHTEADDDQHLGVQLQASNTGCSDEDHVGRNGVSNNMGASKRLRHRHSAHFTGDQDDDNTTAALGHDQQRGLNKQSSMLTQQHGWSRPISSSCPVGKRDHQSPHLIISSPSRAINRRYKLLADVLC